TNENQSNPKLKKIILKNSLMFILGFSIVFVAMGASLSLLGQYFSVYIGTLRKIGAVVIILLGLHIIGIMNIGILQREKRLHIFSDGKPYGLVGSLFVGVAFGAGWTPCIGPILASILIMAGTSDSLATGVLFLVVYSAGLAIPFLLTSLGISSFLKHFNQVKKYFRVVSVTSGVFLIVIGGLIYSNYFAIFTGYMNSWFPFLILN
ncbi:MAG: cytochrome c biogenesis protein CcdA, partial [Thermodesulfobacteriota bacterium]